MSWFEEATKVVVCNWQVPFAEESLSIVGLVCCCCHLRFRKQLSDSWGDGGQGLNCIFAFLSSTVDKFHFQKSKEGIERSNRSNQLWFIDCQHQQTSCPWLLCILSLNRRNQPTHLQSYQRHVFLWNVKSSNVEGSATRAELSWSRLGWAELAYWSLRAFLCGLHSLVMILRRGSLVNKRGWHQVPCKVHIKLLDKFCCNAPSMYVAAAIMFHFRTNQSYGLALGKTSPNWK